MQFVATLLDSISTEYGVIPTSIAYSMQPHPLWSPLRYSGRINKNSGKHLRGPFQPAMITFITVSMNGMYYKADSHSRAMAWQNGYLTDVPEQLIHINFACTTREQMDDIFNSIDNNSSSDTSNFVTHYALEKHELEFKSPYLQGGCSTALRCAEGAGAAGGSWNFDRAESYIATYKQELLALDTLSLSKDSRKGHGRRILNSVMVGVFLKVLQSQSCDPRMLTLVDKFINRLPWGSEEEGMHHIHEYDEAYAYLDDPEKPITDTNALRKNLFRNWFEMFMLAYQNETYV